MEHQIKMDTERELDLTNRTLTLIFFGFLAICGCFFVAGYILGKGAVPTPVNYADRGDAGNSRRIDNYGAETHDRTDEIVSEPITPPSAVIEPSSARPESPGSATAVSDTVQSASLETAPAVSVPPVSIDKPKPQSKETPNKTANASAEKPAPPVKQAASAKAAYSVQVAAFRARRETEPTVKELEARGFESRVEPPPTPGDYYRIKVGSFATRAEAAKMAEQLKKNGFDTMISEIKGN